MLIPERAIDGLPFTCFYKFRDGGKVVVGHIRVISSKEALQTCGTNSPTLSSEYHRHPTVQYQAHQEILLSMRADLYYSPRLNEFRNFLPSLSIQL